MLSSPHVGNTSQILHTCWKSSSSGSASSIHSAIPSSGSDALWHEENSGYIARSTSVWSVLVPNPEMEISSQNVMPSSAFTVNYSSQNGVHLSSTHRFPSRNLVEEYEESLSNLQKNKHKASTLHILRPNSSRET
ncbi:hypothetical protein LOK49_LG11G00569 [Camellia lanceoleosa]|uniref:Uncharacterized protein n=1 Tax=Camellia lanceoleosa TaxID=1840588 RepID=A0ACC0G3A1_9ERIC|nr:hypothetical protein LOK49_LG11G00569 [Camellia lanceoleosa]